MRTISLLILVQFKVVSSPNMHLSNLNENSVRKKSKKSCGTYKNMVCAEVKDSLDVVRVDKVVIILLHFFSGTCTSCTCILPVLTAHILLRTQAYECNIVL